MPGAAAVKHMDEGKEFLHPDSMGANKKHSFKVLAVDAESGNASPAVAQGRLFIRGAQHLYCIGKKPA